MVNLPNWLRFDCARRRRSVAGSGGVVSTDESYELDLRHALLTRRLTVRTRPVG